MQGVEFENFLAEVFREHGYGVTTTKATGDQGVDLVVSKFGLSVAVQAKGYPGSTVGFSAVQEAYTGKDLYRCHGSAVITNSTFTKAARQAASNLGCTLIDGTQMRELIEGRLQLISCPSPPLTRSTRVSPRH